MAAKKKTPEEKEAGASGSTRSLRDGAEKELARSPKHSSELAGQTPEELIHELQVHQIELAMQAEELRRSHLELEELRDRYLDLYEFAPLGYLTLTDKALIEEVNLTGATLLGVEQDEIINHGFGRFITPGDLEEWDRYFANVHQHEEKQTSTLTLLREDGSVFPARLESIRIADSSDGTTTVRMAISDMTDIRRAEEALRVSSLNLPFSLSRAIERKRSVEELQKSEARFDQLAEQSNTITWEVDTPGLFTYVSHVSEAVWGYRPDELVGRMHFSDLHPESGREMFKTATFAVFEEQKPFRNLENAIHARNGQQVWVSTNAIPLQNADGTLRGYRGSDTDITERKRAENTIALTTRKLDLMNDMTYQFIQNKVTGLRGYAELSKGVKTDAERLSFIEKEERILRDIHHLIKNTQKYQKIGLLQPRWIPVEQSIRIAVSLVNPKENIISVEPALHGLELYSDPLIENIFANLIENAVLHGKTTRRITFSCKETPEGLILICEDDGIGISPEIKASLFDRRVGENIRFGLFFVRDCLLLSGMTIRETGEPGNGARFEIVVPDGMWRKKEADKTGA